uniref:hypothetical protein n=1 Tax=Enterobacter cloacae TaxID=550 RepID=UPI0038D0FC4F
MGSCAAPSAKGDDKFITTDYLQQCLRALRKGQASAFYYGDPLGEMRLVSRVFEM